ncbi:MAG TPA: hypothetical protein PKA44_01450 [Saprospiraceae bacterium]|nr:hypothetical protein [Saprospiraceae bacterium]
MEKPCAKARDWYPNPATIASLPSHDFIADSLIDINASIKYCMRILKSNTSS